jgi:tetratricopeptide (TPR) repeat protein
MSSRLRRLEQAEQAAGRIRARLDDAAAGLHRLADPAVVLDSELPPGLAAVLREFDGGELFHEAVVVRSSRAFERSDDGWLVADLGQDQIWVMKSGAVRRTDAELGDNYTDGTSFDRWLAGCIEAESLLLDADGEYREDKIDEGGELVVDAVIERERAWLKRDRHAPGPRWRLAQALLGAGQGDAALEALEAVVHEDPAFVWAWYDLARYSEKRGDLDTAREELRCAVDAGREHEHLAFFLAHQARICVLLGDENGRAAAASRALEQRPSILHEQKEAAQATLDDGQPELARGLAELAHALAPKDLAVLDMLRRTESAIIS